MGNFEANKLVWQQLLSNKAKYVTVGTRKHSGAVVHTPVWFVVDGTDLIIATEDSSGKAKRMRNYPEIDIAECDMRGRIRGQLITAAAQIMPVGVNENCEKLFIKKYKLMYKVYKLIILRGKKKTSNSEDPSNGQIFIRISRNGFAQNH